MRSRYRATSAAYAPVSPAKTRRTSSPSLVPTLGIPTEGAVPSLFPASGGRVTRSTGGRVSPDRAVTVPAAQRSADDSFRVAPARRGPPGRGQLLQGRYHIPPGGEAARPRAPHRCAV